MQSGGVSARIVSAAFLRSYFRLRDIHGVAPVRVALDIICGCRSNASLIRLIVDENDDRNHDGDAYDCRYFNLIVHGAASSETMEATLSRKQVGTRVAPAIASRDVCGHGFPRH